MTRDAMTRDAMTRGASTRAAPRIAACLFLLLGPGVASALAADDASTAPSMPKHEMGGNDSKPGFFDEGKHSSGTNDQKVPAPGKAAGASSPDAPPVPMAK